MTNDSRVNSEVCQRRHTELYTLPSSPKTGKYNTEHSLTFGYNHKSFLDDGWPTFENILTVVAGTSSSNASIIVFAFLEKDLEKDLKQQLR
jgi:hypothetical protein